MFRYHVEIVPSCLSVDNYAIPEVKRSRTTSGSCIRLRFSVRRPMTFYGITLLGPVSLCTLPLLALLVPRPLSRDDDVTGGRHVRVPALLVLVGVFVCQLHFMSRHLRTRLALIGKCCTVYISRDTRKRDSLCHDYLSLSIS